jgi:hypothetical protein
MVCGSTHQDDPNAARRSIPPKRKGTGSHAAGVHWNSYAKEESNSSENLRMLFQSHGERSRKSLTKPSMPHYKHATIYPRFIIGIMKLPDHSL